MKSINLKRTLKIAGLIYLGMLFVGLINFLLNRSRPTGNEHISYAIISGLLVMIIFPILISNNKGGKTKEFIISSLISSLGSILIWYLVKKFLADFFRASYSVLLEFVLALFGPYHTSAFTIGFCYDELVGIATNGLTNNCFALAFQGIPTIIVATLIIYGSLELGKFFRDNDYIIKLK